MSVASVSATANLELRGRQRVAEAEAAADYDAFFRTEYGQVVRVVQGVLGDRARAEEVAQEAFVRLLVRWDKVATYERPDAWVRRVAVRLAVRVSRRDRMRTVLERRVEPPVEKQSSSEVFRLLDRLPRAQRVAIVLHYLEDRPVSDIAAVLGCAEVTARVHLHRARRRLEELLSWQVTDG
ncbi:MAG: hypothetical protein QOG53_120 [Frankiales bacterium]|jgi:RNA polymerase sigma-70 factor (ECF subfamily)|nr:hypothetical protein [Frankiales bacterium]